MQLESVFGCSGSGAGPGGKLSLAGWGPRAVLMAAQQESLRGCGCKAQPLLKTGDLLRSTTQYLSLLQLFYI